MRVGRPLVRLIQCVLLVILSLGAFATNAVAAGSISGRVTSSTTTNGLVGTVVQFYDLVADDFVGSTTTDGTGLYSFNLPAGMYAVLTQDNHGYINEIWDNVKCSAVCDTNSITPVIVGSDPVPNINFVLDPGGRVAGTITDAALNPIAGVTVYFADPGGQLFFSQAVSDATGHYIMEGGSETGNVYAVTVNSLGYRNEVYNNHYCLNCDVIAVGNPIAVVLGATTSNIDFALDAGGRITGTVTDTTPNPLANVEVNVFDSTGNFLDSTLTDGAGHYSTGGLPSGTYHASTNNQQGFVDKLYNNIICPHGFCDQTAATPISVTSPSTTANINFALPPGGTLTGTVTAAAGGAPISNLFVGIFNSAGNFLGGANTNVAGVYSTALPTGTYYASVQNANGYANQLYNNIACGSFCNILSGTPISVTAGQTTGSINFALVTGGSITGTVLNGATMTGIASLNIQLFNSNGNSLSSVNTNGSGVYTFSGLSAGSYYVRTASGGSFINQLYNGVTCIGSGNITGNCPGGTLVPVTAGSTTSNINFTLATGGRISGTITNANTLAPIQGVGAQIVNSSGTSLASFNSDASGNYITSGLPSGTYYVRTTNSVPWIHKLYNDLPCTGGSCIATTGTAVVVTAPSTVPNINFSLAPGGQFSGKITNAANAANLQGVNAQIYNSSGTFLGSSGTDSSGNYITSGLPNGNYYSRSSNNLGYVEKLYNDLPCTLGSCNSTVTSGTAIPITVGNVTANVNFALVQGGRISGTVTNAATSAPIQAFGPVFYTAGGTLVGSVSTNASGTYLTSGLPVGSYFAISSPAGYAGRLYNNLPYDSCTLPCSVTSGTPINVTLNATTPAINFALLPKFAFTDSPLTPQVTAVKAVHITELRTDINLLRQQVSLAPFSFTGTLTPGTTAITVAHIAELRSALDAVYDALGRAHPTYTDPTLVAGSTVIKAVHLSELRSAVLAMQ